MTNHSSQIALNKSYFDFKVLSKSEVEIVKTNSPDPIHSESV